MRAVRYRSTPTLVGWVHVECFDLNCTERSYPQVTEEFELSHYRPLEENKTMFTTFADLEVNFVDGTRAETLLFLFLNVL